MSQNLCKTKLQFALLLLNHSSSASVVFLLCNCIVFNCQLLKQTEKHAWNTQELERCLFPLRIVANIGLSFAQITTTTIKTTHATYEHNSTNTAANVVRINKRDIPGRREEEIVQQSLSLKQISFAQVAMLLLFNCLRLNIRGCLY